MVRERHRYIADRHLPGAHELIATDETTYRAITNRNEEGLVCNGREAQHAIGSVAQIQSARVEIPSWRLDATNVARHTGCLAEKHLDRHIHRIVVEQRIVYDQRAAVIDLPDHGEGAALAGGDLREQRHRGGRDG